MNPEFFNSKQEEVEIEKEKILANLRRLRYEHYDDLPTEKIIPHQTPNWNKYKCRTNFFHAVAGNILRLQAKKVVLGPVAQDEVKKYLEFCKTIEGKADFYQREDIDQVNCVLDVLIEELS